ncbi:PKD domain-containing protein, partial [Halioxenophilus sp. WMMB6]|uniref:PKD domain-containing protein n=1 Tax=Halioxenophilus sp. WMMB6 TaxID=3073815 RepID=UPI00295F0F43
LVSKAELNTGGPSLVRSGESVVIREGVDLNLDVTVTGDSMHGDQFSYYRYVVSNTGNSSLADVVLRVVAPNRAAFSAAASLPVPTGCSASVCNGSEAEWGVYTIGQLDAGETRVIVYPLFDQSPIDGEPMVTHALLTEGSGDYTLGVKPTVLYETTTGLDLNVSASKQVVAAEEVFDYELSFGNRGGSAVQDLVLAMTLPANTTFVSASDGGTESGGVVSWPLNTLNAGVAGKRFVTVQANTGLGDGEVLVSKAELNTAGPSLVRAGESVVIREGVDLNLDVTVTGDSMHGDQFSYFRYVVSNTGNSSLADVVLRVVAPNRAAFSAAASLPAPTGCSASVCNGSEAEWGVYTIGQLDAGETRVIVYPLFDQSPIDGEPMVAHAVLMDGSNDYTLGTTPTILFESSLSPELVIESGEFHVTPGQQQAFKVSVGNPTAEAIGNALLKVAIPAGYSFTSASGRYEMVDGKILWPLGNISPNTWRDETFTLSVAGDVVDAQVLTIDAQLVEASTAGEETPIEWAGISSVVESSGVMTLSTAQSFTSPLGEDSAINFTLTADNQSGVENADVGLYHMVSTYSIAPEATAGVTNCSASTCTSGEWANWALGNIASGGSVNSTIIPALTGTVPPDGFLLVFNTYLNHASTPRHDQILVDTLGVGNEFSVDTNHDSDADGIPDWWELRWGYNRWDDSDASSDDDADESTNLEEYQEETSPVNSDTDGDGILDGPDTNDPLGDLTPVADAGADFNAAEGVDACLDGTGSYQPDDPDHTQALLYLWSQSSGTGVTLDDATVAEPCFTAPNVASSEALVFSLVVTDPGDNASAPDTVTVTVAPDAAPTADAGVDQTTDCGLLVTLNGSNSFDDIDALADLTFAWQETTSTGVTLSDATAVSPTFTTPCFGLTGGAVAFELTVTDSAGQPDTDSVIINVGAQSAPIAASGPDQGVLEFTEVTLDGSASFDTDGTVVSYVWSQAMGDTPVTLSPNANSAVVTFTAPAATDTLTFTLTVTDDDGYMDDDAVVVSVGDVPVPVCVAGPNQNVTEFSDPDNGVLTVVAMDATAGSSIPSGSIVAYDWNQLSGPDVVLTPPDNGATQFTVPSVGSGGASLSFEVVCTSDLGASTTSAPIIINVSNVNRAPDAEAGVGQNVDIDELVTLDGAGSSDPDGDNLSYGWVMSSSTQGSTVALDNPTAATPSFTAPEVDPVTGESFTFTLTVTDDGEGNLMDSDTVIINVAPCACPPVASAGADQSVNEEDVVMLDASASSDPNEDTLTYAWTQLSGPVVTISGANSATPAFTAPAVGAGGAVLEFRVTVSDGSLQDSDQVVVSVADVPTTPAAEAGANQTVLVGSLVSLSGAASSDADGDIDSYLWTTDAGFTLSGAGTAEVSFTADSVGTFTFTLTVTDATGLADSDTVTVTVTPDGDPVANAGSNQTVNEGASVTLNGSGSSDAEGSVTYQWQQVSGPSVTLSGANSVSPSFTAGTEGSLVFRLTVTDTAGNTDTDEVAITVNKPSSGGSGGGGCTIGGTGAFDPTLPLLALLSLLWISRRRIKRCLL